VPGLKGFIVGLAAAAVVVLVGELVTRYHLTTTYLIWALRIVALAAIYVFLFRPAFPNEAQSLAAYFGVLGFYFGLYYGSLLLLTVWLRRRDNQRRSRGMG
jgi:hypothetical protein